MKTFTLLALLLVAAAIVGCTPNQQPALGPSAAAGPKVRGDDPAAVLVLVLDTPDPQQTGTDHTFPAVNALLSKFFRDRAGEEDKIVLAQVANMPQVWTGSPKAFKAKFRDEAAFRAAMKPTGGRVHDTISEAIEFSKPMIGPRSRACLCVFSSMNDVKSQPRSVERLMRELVEFDFKGGSVALYGCGFHQAPRWRHNMEGVIHNFLVSSEVVADPAMPSWD